MAKAEINVQGEAEAKAKGEKADKVYIHSAAEYGRADDIQSVLAFYPDWVNAKDQVTVPSEPRRAQLLIVCWWMDRMGLPLYTTQHM